ncbi:MAG: hypothetical protein M1816_003337 [Peltula sp. TS41687]|nr:MAG: hypothetical protein M1816_003337 [Peltula sp. TS41687]
MASETDSLQDTLQTSLEGAFNTGACPYDKVAALVLYWAEDDFNPSCAEEAKKVVDLFRTDLQYEVQIFPIPMINSRNLLEQAVVNFKCINDGESSLLIIYYSGHADPDEKRGKAVWAAKQYGPPTLEWFEIQTTFLYTRGDVLLIFDCCYASLATKSRGEGRLELLFAAGASAQTPRPGLYSFTQFFVEEVSKACRERNGLRVSELHKLIDKRAEQTPILFNMRSDPKPSILLRPLGRGFSGQSGDLRDEQAPLGAFTFTVSVVEPPSKRIVREFGDWLKSSAPETISAVKIDKIVDLSNGLQDFVLGESMAGIKGRFLDSLGQMHQELVMSEMLEIGEVIARTRMASSFQSTLRSEPNGPPSAKTIESRAIGAFRAIEERISKLSRTIWSLLSNHSDYQTKSDLENLARNPAAEAAEITPAAKMSLLALEMVNPSAEAPLPMRSIRYERVYAADELFLSGHYGKVRVMVEITTRNSGILGSASHRRLSRTCAFLSQPIPAQFQILPCIGYITDAMEESAGGLVYKMPTGLSKYSSLRQQFNKIRRVPLEVRYRMACSLAITLQGLHAVQWVHKGIRADNIFFFGKAGDSRYELDQPWLLGYGHARESAVVSSMQADFRLESRGVLLLEIGLWSRVLDLKRKAFDNAATPQQAFTVLLELAETNLPHVAGTRYANVVTTCLKGWGNNSERTQIDFGKVVTNVLEEIATHANYDEAC